MIKSKLNREDYPWYNFYKDVPKHLKYSDDLMVEVVMKVALKYPNAYAIEYYNNKITYKELVDRIVACAKSLKTIGVNQGDIVSICMPNTPEALIMFYAVNLVGAVSNMIHPLSSEKEIEMYLNKTKSKVIMTIDMNYKKVINIINNTSVSKIIISSAGYSLKGFKKKMYSIFNTDVTKAIKKIRQVFLKAFQNREVISYKKFAQKGNSYYEDYACDKKGDDLAVILYSGGTSGIPKGIMLSNNNINALSFQTSLMCGSLGPGDSIIAILPIFHGFGLGVCIHTCLFVGAKAILVPIFKAKKLNDLIKKTNPTVLVGVPTLFEALVRNEHKKGLDLSNIKLIISGGDVLPENKYNEYNEFFARHGSKAKIRVGYGLTESTAASCFTPSNVKHRPNSIGIPLPDMIYKIVKIGTTKEADVMEDGEICINGPTVMLGYLNEEEETRNTLREHKDGKIWLHTGDVGCMDEDGFVYFKSRIKRIIISSGYNVYPSYIEEIINKHEYVSNSTVIGVPDKYRGQRVKAYVVLKKEVKLDENVKEEIKQYCEKYIAKYALPREYEFKNELPKTLVGKIAYTVLEEEEKLKEKLNFNK